jgi:hypothetical protein
MASTLYWYFEYPKKLSAMHIGIEYWGCDFHAYYEAGRGNFTWAEQYQWDAFDTHGREGFIYPKPTAYFWYWCRWFAYSKAYFIWCIVLAGTYILVLERIFSYAKTEFTFLCTWFCALVSIKFFSIALCSGNMVPIIAFLLLTPAGCILAGCFKFWAIAFIPLHLFLEIAGNDKRRPIVFFDTIRRWSILGSVFRNYSKIPTRGIAICFVIIIWIVNKL